MRFKGIFIAILASLLGAFAAQALTVSPEGQVAFAPDVAVNAKGEIAVLWVDKSQGQAPGADRHRSATNLYVAVSRDGGATFGDPVKVNREDGAVWGQAISRPRIVASAAGTWHVTYTANEDHPTIDNVTLTTHYTRSTDGGASFEAPRRLSTISNLDLSATMHGGYTGAAAFGTIAAAPDGSVRVMWIDTRHMDEHDSGALYTAVSHDDGVTFGEDREYLDASVCPCCQFMAIADGNSDVLLSTREVSPENFRQSTVARIDAKTGDMGPRVDTGGTPWQIAGCPLKPTALAAQGDAVFAAVHNGAEDPPAVVFSFSADGARSFSHAVPVHPEAIVSDAPSLAASDRYVLAAWHAKTTGDRRVFTRMYGLNGAPAGPVKELPAEPGMAQNPVVAARADGTFQIAWQQGDRILTTTLPAAPAEDELARQ